ncbi:MAG: lectin-like domain-containing protein [Bacteroidia bacterium]
MKKLLYISFLLLVFQPFKAGAQFIFNGNPIAASTTSSECSANVATYLLTEDQGNQSGEIWYTTQVNLNQRFDIQFQLFLGTKCYGCSKSADGICFVFQQQSTTAGSLGGGMGFGGITPSVGVEFDTYQNGWDPAFCHTAIEKNGDVDHTDGSGNQLSPPAQLDPGNPTIPDGNWHNVEIIWDPISKTLSVYFECSLRTSYTGDIVNDPTIFNGNPNVYWGFTAGTGGGYNTQEVCITHSYLNNLRDTTICAGSPVTLTSTGGASYSWAPAAGLSGVTGASVTATPTATTTYTVSITNSCGLVTTDSALIRVSNTVLTPTSTSSTCGNPTGSAAVAATGGIAPYTYAWSNGLTTTSITNLNEGSYTITSIDSLGCKATATVAVAGTPPLRDSIAAFTNVSVACGNNGTATVGVKGGGGTYTYSWNSIPSQTTPEATNLPAGNYTVTVTDNNSCVTTATVAIAQPGALTASIPGSTNVSCFGGNNGSAIAGTTGGNSPYTYLWSNGETSAKDTLLPAGNDTVWVTDANGCTVKATTVITQPTKLSDSMAVTIEVLCFGENNGSLTDGTSGGTGPYTYSWNTAPLQATQTANNLAAGSYTVTITDANSCKDSAVATITQPKPLTLVASGFPATCNGECDGLATVIPSGGTGPYSYLWSNSTSATTANVNNLCAGSYSVMVTDFNGCWHDTTNLVVTQPSAITAFNKTTTIANCNKPDGSASISGSGGTPGYTYLWSNGSTLQNITNVTPGPYCVLVKDKLGCQDTACVIVPNKPGVATQIVATTTVTCNDSANGTATDTAVGGTSPYTYNWLTNPPQSTPAATGLSAGIYSVVVTDANGCIDTSVATITQPRLVTASAQASSAIICIGQTDTLTANAVGGTPPYIFTWSTGVTNSSCVVSPAVDSTYKVTTADANNCPGAAVPVTVTVNPPLKLMTNPPVAICPGSDTTVTATASGGDGTYTYTWNPGGMAGQSVTVSPAATCYYTVMVHDNCTTPVDTDSMEVIVDPLPNIAFKADTTNGCSPSCISFSDISTIASGGLKSWEWNFGDGNKSPSENPKYCYTVPGVYTVSVTVTSDSGCSSSLTKDSMITVYSHPRTEFAAAPQPTNITNPNITFTDLTSDKYGIIQWEWNLGDSISGPVMDTSNLQNPLHTYSDTGTFCVKLLDINKHSCADSSTACIEISPLFTFYIPNAFTPGNGNDLNTVFIPKGIDFTTFDMYIFNRWGTPIFHTTSITNGWNGGVNNGSVMCPQDTYVYVIHVTDFRGEVNTYIGKVTLLK